VLAVLVERGRADGAQLAAGQHRLEQVGGVHGALGGAGADDRVQLVDEEDDLAAGVGDLLEDRLQALLELAAVLRAREQRADVQGDDAAVAQRLGDVAGDNALGKALDDRGLADTRLADEDRVVLRAAREHLHDAADLVVAADDGVELAVAGGLREVAAVLLERLVLVLGLGVGHAVRAAHLGHGLRQRRLRRAGLAQRVAGGRAVAGQREQDVLGGDVLVLELAHLVLGGVEDLDELAGGAGGLAARPHGRHGGQRSVQAGADELRVDAELRQHRRDDAALLVEQREQQVLGRRLRIPALVGE
jgi:hypothetical protein